MPVSFLTAEQERRYGRYAGEPSAEQLARHFHLDDADRELAGAKRWDHMRLGFAVQLGTVRFLGAFLDEPATVPMSVAGHLAQQLGISDAGCLTRYATARGRWLHSAEIKERHGYREFTDPFVHFRLTRWLYALCWTGTDRPSVLFDRATIWLVTEKVLLPGASALERLIARVRTRAVRRLWRTLSRNVTPEQRVRLDALLIAGEGGRPSPLDRLRDGPYLRSGGELSRAVGRLDEVRVLTLGLPIIDHVPPGRVTALARFATVSKAQAVARMPLERRTATLLAFVRTLEATAQDDVLDLFDIVVTTLFTDAAKVGKKARLRTIRDLDAAALQLRRAGGVLMDEAVKDDDVREAAFAIVPRTALAAALEQIDAIVRPPGDLYFIELRAQTGKLRFLPAMLRSVALGATPAGQPALDAVRHLRSTDGRGPAPSAPVDFVPSGWKRQVRAPDGGVDSLGYRLCLLEALRTGIRRRDLFAFPSLRYADPRIGFLAGPVWEAARPSICRTLGLSIDAPAEVARLAKRLDTAYCDTAANLPDNAAVQVDGGELVLSAPRVDLQPCMLRHLRSLIPGQRLPELFRQADDRVGDAVADGFGTMPCQRGSVLHASAHTVLCHPRQVQQHREPRCALYQRADRGTLQAQDEVAFPVTRHSPIGHFRRALADHDLRHDKGLASSATARPWHTQRPPGAQTGRQLAAQSPTALHVKRLVDGFMADAHRLIVREVVPQAVSNLLRAPRRRPAPIFPRSVSATFPGYRRPGNRNTAWRDDHTSQPILHIRPQRRIEHQLCRLRTSSSPFSMPLRGARPIIQLATASGGVAAQLPRDRRSRPPHVPGDLPHPGALSMLDRKLLPLGKRQVSPRQWLR